MSNEPFQDLVAKVEAEPDTRRKIFIVREYDAKLAEKLKELKKPKPLSVLTDLIERAQSAAQKAAALTEELARVNRLLALPLPERVERWRKEAAAMTARAERLKETLNIINKGEVPATSEHEEPLSDDAVGMMGMLNAQRVAKQALAFCDKSDEEINSAD